MLATESNVEVRHEFLQRMTQARSETDKLFELVKSNSLYARPIPERHRIVFYIGHLEAFDWNLLRERVVDARIFHPDFDRLFAFGIDTTQCGYRTPPHACGDAGLHAASVATRREDSPGA